MIVDWRTRVSKEGTHVSLNFGNENGESIGGNCEWGVMCVRACCACELFPKDVKLL